MQRAAQGLQFVFWSSASFIMMMQPVPQAPLPEGVPPLFPIPLAAVPPFGASTIRPEAATTS